MASRDKIVKFCEDFLEVNKFQDVFHNGLQVEGCENVSKIVTGVTFSKELAEIAVEKNSQMIMVHHGVSTFDFSDKFRLTGYFKNRLSLVLKYDLNLLGFHLPLDAHDEIGNNARICQELGLVDCKKFDDDVYGEIGFIGRVEKPISRDVFVKNINEKLGTNSSVIGAGPELIGKVGIVSGGAGDDFRVAQKFGADTFITGEIKEHNFWQAKELGVNLIVAGHYNTEKLGIKALGERVAEKFGVKVEFVDISCDF